MALNPGLAAGKDIIARRHEEWLEHQLSWRWLADSYEGGNRYRQAIYGTDSRGLPIRNLIRHKREYPDPREQSNGTANYIGGQANGLAGAVGDAGGFASGVFGGTGNGIAGSPGSDYTAKATDDDYEMRRARTPVPTFVSEVVDKHLGKIYAEEVGRDFAAAPELEGWAEDVDGLGSTLDEWMQHTVAPLLMTLGNLDLVFDHPPRPDGAEVQTQADVLTLGLDRCVASYILPENVIWWKQDAARQYTELLVREYKDAVDRETPDDVNYRHWTRAESTLYDGDGKILSTTPHKFGRPPILRLFDRRKPRCVNVGRPRYEGIAERQREYYNRDSELILSDTIQAHPLLQGPDDYAQADGLMPLGPNWLMPMKKNGSGNQATYQGFSCVTFPKDGADSLRKNKADIRDDVDRDACLTKPAGAAGTDGKTVAQSGVSKQIDHNEGAGKLGEIAKVLARAERSICAMVLVVLRDDSKAVEVAKDVVIAYPATFNLLSAEELMTIWTAFLATVAQAEGMTETNLVAFLDFVQKALPGRSDAFYQTAEDEIREFLSKNGERNDQALEMRVADLAALQDATGEQPDETDTDPDGESDAGGEGTSPTPGPVTMFK